MRVSKSKFAKPVPKYFAGGVPGFDISSMMGQMGQMSPGSFGGQNPSGFMQNPNAKGSISGGSFGGFGNPMNPQDMLISYGISKLTKPAQVANPTNEMGRKAAENYESALDKEAKTQRVIKGIGASAKPLDMVVPGLGTAIGQTANIVSQTIPLFNKKPEQAFRDFQKSQERGEQLRMLNEGALSYNKMEGFQAPAYGRKGMKFKTKYSRK